MNAAKNAGEYELLLQVDQDCYKLEKMIFHSPEELDDVVFDFGIVFGYMPKDIRDRSSSEQRCYAQAMARSKSFKKLMARSWD